MPSVFFYRSYGGITGGHLKVWDYFNHFKASGLYSPYVNFEDGSLFDRENPWLHEQSRWLHKWEPEKADLLFMAGDNWKALPESKRAGWPRPVINLIQGLRHADPKESLYGFLSHHAIRICVSKEVEKAILKTGSINGPVFTIPNGIDRSLFNERNIPPGDRSIDILIVGMKNPGFTLELQKQINSGKARVRVVTEKMPRHEFLALLANSRITIFLPSETEGFYLPALEGMAAGTLVICPDCIGNRSYCFDMQNALMPEYNIESFIEALNSAMAMPPQIVELQRAEALKTSRRHSIESERESFLRILRQVDRLWTIS